MPAITACARSPPIAATTTAACASASAIRATRPWCSAYVLGDFAKAEEPWVEDLCRAIADNADLLATGEDASFQNKVHLAMEARGWTDVKRPGEKAETDKE